MFPTQSLRNQDRDEEGDICRDTPFTLRHLEEYEGARSGTTSGTFDDVDASDKD